MNQPTFQIGDLLDNSYSCYWRLIIGIEDGLYYVLAIEKLSREVSMSDISITTTKYFHKIPITVELENLILVAKAKLL